MPDTPFGDTPAVALVDEASTNIVGAVKSKFEDAETGRYQHEQRWLKAYKNFRGIYDSTTQFRESEKSRVFLKITKTKVLAAYGQIIDVLFANKKFPIVVESTPIPEGIAEFAHLKTTGLASPTDTPEQPEESPYGFPGDGKNLTPGATKESLESEMNLGAFTDDLAPISQKLNTGIGKTSSAQTFFPAQQAAKRMEKKILDQLEESSASKHLRNVAFEMALFGTGILK